MSTTTPTQQMHPHRIERAAISVHDVMPETLDKVRAILGNLRELRLSPVTLLVVPGRTWDAAGLAQLRRWYGEEGHILAGHGWSHRCPPPTSLYHKLHSRLISREVAEHLALTELDIIQLIQRCHAWFGDAGLPLPDLYVPPAWAMGNVRMQQLAQTPFRYFEYMGGVYDADAKRFAHIPLCGYEADTAFRAATLRMHNATNLYIARTFHCPVRLSIHPYDFELNISKSLHAHLSSVKSALTYEELFARSNAHAQPRLEPSTPTQGASHEN